MRKHGVHLDKEHCKDCRFCLEFGPQHILYETKEVNSKGYNMVQMTCDGVCNACEK